MAADEERLPGPAGLDVCGLQIIDYGGRGGEDTRQHWIYTRRMKFF